MHHLVFRILAVTGIVFIASFDDSLQADNWPAWRGPTLNGVAATGEYPTSWSSTENIAWKVKLDGRGASTPIVWDDNIMLTMGRDGKNVLVSYDRSGKLNWDLEVGTEEAGKHKKASGSNPSCVTDGKLVFAYFKSGDLVAADLKGNLKWHHNVQKMYGEDTLWWDLGTSPILTRDHVIITVMQTGPSYLAAFDKESGKAAWKVDRNLEAPEEAAQAYSTPVVETIDGKERIYVLGADHVTGHDAATGSELWRVGGLNPTQHQYFRSISGPVVAGNMLIAPYARGGSVTGIRLGGRGDVTKSHVAWTAQDVGSDVPTPTFLGDRIFICRDSGRSKGSLTTLNLKTGEIIDEVLLEKNRHGFSSSPTLAGTHLYVTREDGTTFVVDVSGQAEVIATNSLNDEFTVATPVLVDGRILIRTYEHLYCIGR